MGLLRKKGQFHIYAGVHDNECLEYGVDLTKKYTVCNEITKDHLSTDDWQEADKQYIKWSGEKSWSKLIIK